MKNEILQAFFNGAFDMLQASFSASQLVSNATAGAKREDAARELLRALIPPVARVESGDLIDIHGGHSGQLDAVVVDHRAPTLKFGASTNALIFAEGALAVLEVKSNAAAQWSQVMSTFAKVAPIRARISKQGKGASSRALRQASIPFVVLANKGWANQTTFGQRCEDLRALRPDGSPIAVVITLDPPLVGWLDRGDKELDIIHPSVGNRGDTLAILWYLLVNEARLHSRKTLRRMSLPRYFSGVRRIGAP